MDYTIHGILQARILAWVAFPFCRGSSQPIDRIQVYLHCRQILYQLSYEENPCNVGDLDPWVESLGWEDPLEKGKATHSSILAWRIPWTVQSMGSH